MPLTHLNILQAASIKLRGDPRYRPIKKRSLLANLKCIIPTVRLLMQLLCHWL